MIILCGTADISLINGLSFNFNKNSYYSFIQFHLILWIILYLLQIDFDLPIFTFGDLD